MRNYLIELTKQVTMAKKPTEINTVAIYSEDRYVVAKELMAPLGANKMVILTRQIKQNLLSPMVDAPKSKIFNKWKKCRRNIRSQKLSQKIEQALPLGLMFQSS
jgi:hypothetical protein